jgi:hypothetical protein
MIIRLVTFNILRNNGGTKRNKAEQSGTKRNKNNGVRFNFQHRAGGFRNAEQLEN